MIFDTDVLICIQRNHSGAIALAENSEKRFASIWTYMELIQGAKNARHQHFAANFLREFNFQILPLSENIGHRASTFIERFALSHGLLAGDALIAATATEMGMALCSSNAKHFKAIPDLKLKVFKP